MSRRCGRGLALILVVGVLGVLAVLGSAFAVLSRLERKAAVQRVLGTQALLLSRSGIEDATARLGMGQDPDAATSRYGGEDWAGDGWDAFDQGQEVYRPGVLDVESCPVQQATRPSFFVADSLGKPTLMPVEGRQRGLSGRVSTGTWALKVIPQAGFFVNGGDPAATVSSSWDYNSNLRRMLGILAKAVDEQSAPLDGQPVTEADGFNLIDRRPGAGWESWEQVKALALGGSQDKLDALRPYLTLRAWVDRKVIKPNPNPPELAPFVPTFEGMEHPSMFHLRMMTHWAINQGPTPFQNTCEPGFERIPMAPPWGPVVGRAPVNLGWARKRKPALLALLGNLKGVYLDGTYGQTVRVPDNGFCRPPQIGITGAAEISLSWSPADDSHRLADRILACTSELATWEAWNLLCDALPVSGPDPAVQKAKQSILKANFNPNSDLAKFNPPPALMKNLDKSDLLVHSTEFSLLPVHDHQMESVGRASLGGRILASRSFRALLSAPSVFRLDTQKEFACGNLGRLDVAGDESGLRLPGSQPFLSLSRGTGATWGHTLPGMGGKGLGLQTYPEPAVDPGGGLAMRPADYDGHLRLATVETQADDAYAVTATTADMKMLARFDDGYDLDLHDGPAFACLPDTSLVPRDGLAQGLYAYYHDVWGDEYRKGVSLFPDGAYCDYGNAPAWPDRGNANGVNGIISFWVRRFDPARWGGGGDPSSCTYGYGSRYLHWTNFGTTPPSQVWSDPPMKTQVFFLGPFVDCTGIYGEGFCCFFELGRLESDVNTEMLFRSRGMDPRPFSWNLVTLYYDFRGPTHHGTCDLFVNQQVGLPFQGALDVYKPFQTSSPSDAMDITDDDVFGPHRLSLGGREEFVVNDANGWNDPMYSHETADCGPYYNTGANATIDELAVYDFGNSEAVAAQLAAGRFKEGRFYKGAAYSSLTGAPQPDQAASWFSAPIPLEGSRLSRVAWTWYRSCVEAPNSGGRFEPSALGEYPEVELADASGSQYLFPGSCSTSGLGGGTWAVGRRIQAPFRAHVVFRRRVPVDADTPLLDSPILDDLTFLYEPQGGAHFLSWGP